MAKTTSVNFKIADMEPVRQRFEHAATVIERLRAGLVDIIDGQECESFTGRPYCRDAGSGRSREGVFGAERWCDTCIAHDALAGPPIGASE